MNTPVTEVSDAVKQSLGTVLSDAQDLLDSMRTEGAEKYGAAYQRLQSNVRKTRKRLERSRRTQVRRIQSVARRADETVHEHPWATAGTAMMVGAAAGALAAFFLTRRD